MKAKDGKEREDKLQKELAAKADALKVLEVQSANEAFSLNNQVASLASQVSSLQATNANLTAAAQSQGGAGEALKARLADALKEAEEARQGVKAKEVQMQERVKKLAEEGAEAARKARAEHEWEVKRWERERDEARKETERVAEEVSERA